MKNVLSKLTLCFFVVAFTLPPSFADSSSQEDTTSPPHCSAAKEFITTLEYLRDRKTQFQVGETQARAIATRVASHCNHAAIRFILVTDLLAETNSLSKDAIQLGIDFAGKTDEQTEAFVEIFQIAYLKDYLDLDLRTSLSLATRLMNQLKGSAKKRRDDFQELARFCVGSKTLGLPRPQCADFAVRILTRSKLYKEGASSAFIRSFEFLTHPEEGPGLSTAKSLALAEEILSFGPGSDDNLVKGYHYALKEEGLGLGKKDAIQFAVQLAKEQIRNWKSPALPKNKNLKTDRKLAEDPQS